MRVALLRRAAGRRGGVGASLLGLTALVVAAVQILSPATAHAGEGFTLDGATTYRVDATVPAVLVSSTYTMTNTRPDRSVGNRVEFFYFEGITVVIAASASEVVVLVDGDPAESTQRPVDDAAVLDIDFGYRLRYGRSATIEVSYRMLGDPPRSDGSFVRVNPAYVSFPVLAYADGGRADVRVEVPDDWTPDFVGSEFDRRSTEGDAIVFESDDIDDPSGFGVLFTAREDDLLDSTALDVGGDRFEIRSWPGDGDWLAFARRHVSEGLPVLERLVGRPWPEANETEVIEASTPYLRGYAGFYFADTDVIEVGEDLDSHTVLHELSHAWFNGATVADRWISEGLADAIGARAVVALGGKLPLPSDYDPDAPVELESFPLNEWRRPTNALDDTTEFYGYRTSFEVMQALYDELGEEQMTALVAAVVDGDRAYQGGTVERAAGAPVGWRAFLDLAEQVGGSAVVDQLYRRHVVTDAQAGHLDDRSAAIEEYDALVARGGSWDPPEAIRSMMADWRFALASGQIAAATAALDVRDELAAGLEPLGLQPASSLETAYEDGRDVDTITLEIDQQLAAAVRLGGERAELTEQLASLDLDVPALTQADYDAEPIAIAASAAQLSDQAAELVAANTELAATLAAYELSVPQLAASAFVDSPEGALESLASLQRAADTVVDANRASDTAGSVLERLGGIGSDVETDLDAAAAALAAGDAEAATAAAGEATATIDTWTSRGTARLVAVGLGLAGGLLAVLAVHVVRRRRLTSATGTQIDRVDATSNQDSEPGG